jgi:lysozyme
MFIIKLKNFKEYKVIEKSNLLVSIKHSEGFAGMPYDDQLGNPTIGYGCLLPLSELEATILLNHRLLGVMNELDNNKPFVKSLEQEKQEVLYEMAYQLGVPRLLMFKRMWTAIESGDFVAASYEMLDSRWANQTPKRASNLAIIMKKGV